MPRRERAVAVDAVHHRGRQAEKQDAVLGVGHRLLQLHGAHLHPDATRLVRVFVVLDAIHLHHRLQQRVRSHLGHPEDKMRLIIDHLQHRGVAEHDGQRAVRTAGYVLKNHADHRAIQYNAKESLRRHDKRRLRAVVKSRIICSVTNIHLRFNREVDRLHESTKGEVAIRVRKVPEHGESEKRANVHCPETQEQLGEVEMHHHMVDVVVHRHRVLVLLHHVKQSCPLKVWRIPLGKPLYLLPVLPHEGDLCLQLPIQAETFFGDGHEGFLAQGARPLERG
mmetsp:Transcript_2518/g.9738  ORF Transcript_2518/g.9738 Transcript_2518/m.9738 type:complete len:280 (+) Transcript_2518:463-1302(+)